MELALSTFAYSCSVTLTLATGLLVFLRSRQANRARDSAVNNSDFRALQAQFVRPYLVVLSAGSLQTPFLYVLYHSYRFIPAQIAVLHVTGLLVCEVISLFTGRFINKYGPKVVCITCILALIIGCLLKISSSFSILFLARIFDGISAAFIARPFEEWYMDRHVSRMDFPKEWSEVTFSRIAKWAAFLAVFAGFLSNFAQASASSAAAPFCLSALVGLLALAYIAPTWDSAKLADSNSVPLFPLSKQVSSLLRHPVALVITVIATFVEAALEVFIFVWSAVIIKAKTGEGLPSVGVGVAFSCLMAFVLFGSTLCRIANSALGLSNARLLSIGAATATLALYSVLHALPKTVMFWKDTNFTHILAFFCLLEFAAGFLRPSLAKLRAEYLPSVSKVINIPVAILSSVSILLLHPLADAQRTLFFSAFCLLAMATFLAVLLDVVVSSRATDSPRSGAQLAPPRQPPFHPTVHSTPSRDA